MRINLICTLAACSMVAFTSCSKLGSLSADNFTVTPNPLETQAGKVPATINGNFPEKYMKKKATVKVTPELRYGNGNVVKGQSATFQGEKVLGNNQTISYRVGGRYTMKTSFDYVPEMQKSELYLTFDARKGSKKYDVPDVKVADGVIATSELYKRAIISDGGCIAPDSFQRVKAQKQEANIKFLVNQANLRKSELKNNSVTEFVQMLKKINADREGLNINNVEIQAYASPEGGVSFNDKLAYKRQVATEGYVQQQLNATNVETGVDAHYTAQDWDGFKQLVQASNIQDKDVVLRVLSMYKDPEERETQIRNMSAVFRELADGILPELRRSRLIINYETVGRSDKQIQDQYEADPTKLSADEMLYAAALQDDIDKQEAIYNTAAKYFDKDYRAYNNLAAISLAKGDKDAAETYLTKALSINKNAEEAYANLGLLSLLDGNVSDAETQISKAASSENVSYALGVLDIAKGNYAQAESTLESANTNAAALAQLLNKNYSAGAETLENVSTPDALTDYLHAIIVARQGNKYATSSYLKQAIEKDPTFKTYSENDLELSLLK